MDQGTWLQHCRLATGLLLHIHIAIVPEHPIAPAGIMNPLHLPTPHPTQALMQPNDHILPSRHERFYSQDPMLKDPVILQVCQQSKLVFIYNNKARQVERTLYRLSIYALAQGSDFCQGGGLNLLFVNFLQRISRCEGVCWTKNRGLEGVWEIGELVGLAYVLGESVLS